MKKIFTALPFLAISVACDDVSEDTGAPEPVVDERVDGLEDRVYGLEVAATDLDLQATDLDLRITDLELQTTDLDLQATDLDLRTTELEAKANIANDRLDSLESVAVQTYLAPDCPRFTVEDFVVTENVIILSITHIAPASDTVHAGFRVPVAWRLESAMSGEDNVGLYDCGSDLEISYIVTD